MGGRNLRGQGTQQARKDEVPAASQENRRKQLRGSGDFDARQCQKRNEKALGGDRIRNSARKNKVKRHAGYVEKN